MRFEQRNIFLAKVRFSNSSEFKKRPVVIISNNRFNNSCEDVICCPITSHPSKNGIIIDILNMEEGRLLKKSQIKSKYPFFLEKNEFDRYIGKIDIKTAKMIIIDIEELVSLR